MKVKSFEGADEQWSDGDDLDIRETEAAVDVEVTCSMRRVLPFHSLCIYTGAWARVHEINLR